MRPSHVSSIRTTLPIEGKLPIEGTKRYLAHFNLAIESKRRGCNVVAIRIDDVAPSGDAIDLASIRLEKTGRRGSN